MKTSIFAPATIANFSVGFDSLGVALSDVEGSLFGDVVTIEPSAEITINMTGEYVHKLPENPIDNLVVKCSHLYHKHLLERHIPYKTFTLTLEKRMPIGSGLGSSSASIVAALVALNHFYGHPFSDQELFLLAGEMERSANGSIHYDNVAPCLLGGMQLIMQHTQTCESLPFFEDWILVIYHPGTEILTEMARKILPYSLPRTGSITYWQKFACFVHALHTKNSALAAQQMYDVLIEPYRATLIPYFNEGRAAAIEAGALAFGIAGSGPTCFAITESISVAHRVRDALTQNMNGTKESFSKICTISKTGARPL